jgi:hypothetical protein
MKKIKPMKIQAMPACAVQIIRPRNLQNTGAESLPKYLYLLMTFARPADQPNRGGEGAGHKPKVSISSCCLPAPPVALMGKRTGQVMQQPTKEMTTHIFKKRRRK